MGFESWQGEKNFPFSKTSKPDLSPKQKTIQWVPGFFPKDESVGGVKLTTHFHPLLRLYVIITKALLPQYAFMAWRRAPSLEAFFVSHTY